VAKRKSTDKTSKDETDQKVETDRAPDQSDASEKEPTDLEVAAEAVEAVEVYAPTDDTTKTEAAQEDALADVAPTVTDDVIEQAEPKDDAPEETPAQTEVDAESAEADPDNKPVDGAAADNHLTEEEAEKLIEEAESVEGHPDEPKTEAEPETPPVAPQVIKETTVERKGGLVPMLVGGAAAAVLGYGVAAYSSQAVWPFDAATDTSFEDEVRGALTTQDGALSDLGARLSSLEGMEPPSVDLTPVQDQIAAVQATAADLTARLDEIVSRIDTLERQPLESSVSEEAIAAYERALADLQAEIETQRVEVAQMAQDAVAAEENAEEKALLAASRAALAELTTALNNGASYSGAVAVLETNGVVVPEAIASLADQGVPTQTSLNETFPEAARAALGAARSIDTEGAEGIGRVTTFFANQLGARSVAPKEGDDPDAVLSRAEAAVRSGDLSTALSELSGLPDVAQEALADWQARAETRLAATSAADELVQQLLQE